MYLVTIGAETPIRRAASAKLPSSTTLANATMQVNLSIFLSPRKDSIAQQASLLKRAKSHSPPAPISRFDFSRRVHGWANSMLTPPR